MTRVFTLAVVLSIAFLTGCTNASVKSPLTVGSVKARCPATTEAFSNIKCRNDVRDLRQLEQDVLDYSTRHPEHQVLIVFDIDDTLLTSTNFFGGDAWYRWQRKNEVYTPEGSALKLEERDETRCIFAKLNVLYELSRFSPTQDNAGEIVARLGEKHSVLALTSRSPGARSGTERELNRAQISFADFHMMKNSHSLHYTVGSRGVSYVNGIVMSTGLDKGLVLDDILRKIDRHKMYQAIFFVDDGAENLADVANFWRETAADIHLYHYTRISKSISREDIEVAELANRELDEFIETAYPDRWRAFKRDQCQ